MIKAFPKIFVIGQDYIIDIFKEEVEITEKIDGSQFDFGKINGELYFRSKGVQLYPENAEKLFLKAIEYVLSIQDKIPDNTVFYCEYLKTEKHNVLKYNRVPKNNLALFGISNATGTKFISKYEELKQYADLLDIEAVPMFYYGKIDSPEQLVSFLEKESILGGVKIEGVVVKNYQRQFLLGGQPIPLMMGKYVSESFKEVHRKSWGKEFTAKGKWELFKDSFRTEARWHKAIQHLRDNGELEFSPKDIGKLLKEIQKDIEEEEKENIKEFLWNEYGKDIMRRAVIGFPEFYKNFLLQRSFEENKNNEI
jgi:hypothetical protein